MLRQYIENTFSDFFRIYRVLPRSLRRAVLRIFALTGILSLVEILSIFSISALAMSVAAPEKLLAVKPVAWLLAMFPLLERLTADPRFLALLISGCVVGFIAAKSAFAALVNVKTLHLKENVALFVGETVFRRYLYSPYIAHLAGDSQTMFQALSQRGSLSGLLSLLIMIYTYAVLTLALFIIAIVVTPWPVLLVLAASTTIAVLIYKMLKGRLDAAGMQQVALQREASKCTMNAMRGIRETLAYRQQEVFFSRFRRTCLDSVPGNTFLSVAPFMPVWILEVIGFTVIPVSLWVMYSLLDASMARITGVLTMIMLVAWRVLPMLNRTVAAMVTARSHRHAALTCLEGVEEALTMPVPESPDPDPDFALREGIRLERVSFRYPKAETDCLSGIDCFIPCGSRVGIIGTSGAGKSTLALVVSGMVQPDGGVMLLDGREPAPEELAAYCLKVGYVSQSPYLMPGTLAENVAFSQWGTPWDEEKVRLACRMAKLDVAETRGLEMGIGDNGAGLSGGQAQRLSIARALYVNPSVLILDEATSALDGGVENAIMDTIFALPQSITTIIIAHRLSTVERCDTLLWLEDGRLVASGPPEELLPRYQEYLNTVREG